MKRQIQHHNPALERMLHQRARLQVQNKKLNKKASKSALTPDQERILSNNLAKIQKLSAHIASKTGKHNCRYFNEYR